MKDIRENPVPEAAHIFAYEVGKFCTRHGTGLCELVEIIHGDAGVDAYCDLLGELCQKFPDPIVVKGRLLNILRALEEARDVPLAFSDALRWNGAKLSDLAAREMR
ncbi:hypothetical protein FIU97_19360 (plasmid) [Roseivivax sp. THAF40]|uniref:hypothetical protein n=1 Tax=unclassified Roseivivax TaxID=2639302 RepID=UPI00126975D8|nr:MULTISPECIES: hypothetical protein [unclassified Roseivivax]QFS84852.1 hypothetical protein FIV09_18575 [Roseivivax sp. THAF197b]QFT48754.1 hypothetical protein FIU97_19360 [Roseivivax sp. THAF40]